MRCAALSRERSRSIPTMRRAALILGMVLLLSACGEDTTINGQSTGELCRSLESEFMKEPAPDRRQHADRVLRAFAGTAEWRELSVDERREVEATVDRAVVGHC